MEWRTPIGPLVEEHRAILRVVAVIDRELVRSRANDDIDPRFVDTVVDFLRTFADRCHHGKEEEILFRDLARKDLEPELRRQMDELIAEHVEGRQITARLVDATRQYEDGATSSLSAIQDALGELATLYPAHIEKEESHFFRESMQYFSDAEKTDMLLEGDRFEQLLLHEKYEEVVESLESRAR